MYIYICFVYILSYLYNILNLSLQKADTNFEREKAILWQRFLIDPDTLRKTYKQLKTVTKRSCFDDALKKELNDSL